MNQPVQAGQPMSDQVTVCIPTYNRANFLREAIQSVLNQTYTHVQVLVCDNASTDNTAEVVKSFDAARVTYHRQPFNVGIAGNHQTCAELASTDYVAFLSDDDLYKPDHIESCMAALREFPTAAYVTCPLEIFGEGGREDDRAGEQQRDQGNWVPAGIKNITQPLTFYPVSRAVDFLAVENPGFLNTIVCRKAALKGVAFWGKPGYVHTDVLAMTQLMVGGGFVFSDTARVMYRRHETNISRGAMQLKAAMRLKCMYWYAVAYLGRVLMERAGTRFEDFVRHGLALTEQDHVVSLVIGLASFGNPREMRAAAKAIFDQRKDVDAFSSRFRLARKLGFWALPASEVVTRWRTGWRP